MGRLDLDRLDDAVRHENGVTRRLLLGMAASLAATPWLAWCAAQTLPTSRPTFASDPFTLGVASGDPDDRGVVLWTKLAPAPLTPDGGLPADAAYDVEWEVAEDESMRRVVRHGVTRTTADLGHSVHAEADGLKPDRWYWYRFRCGDAESPIGRTRTLPGPQTSPKQMRFAFASCQHYQGGYYIAHRHMAADPNLDCVFFLGDYIYEDAGNDRGVRRQLGGEVKTLADYRRRHNQYRADPDLQAAHRHCPWWVTWDDHEVSNDYAGPLARDGKTDPAVFLQRRAAAYRAYYEMMPLRSRSLPRGPDLTLYRSADFGRLARFNVLDTRQYRSHSGRDNEFRPIGDKQLAPASTILGPAQRDWLHANLADSPATWNVLAQQVMMHMLARPPKRDDPTSTKADTTGRTVNDKADAPLADPVYCMDNWPGYARDRIDLAQFLADRKIANPVVLTGDIHANFVADLRIDDRRPDTPPVAVEFTGTSISSDGNGTPVTRETPALLHHNPGLHWHNSQRGYVRCTLTPDRWQSDYVVCDHIDTQAGTAALRKSFVVEAGRAGVQEA